MEGIKAYTVILILLFLVQPIALADYKEREQQEKQCLDNLRKIGEAIKAYRADHGNNMPNWLSDLYPRYLKDPKILICPADKKGGNPYENESYYKDPKMGCSYQYDFNPNEVPWSWSFEVNPPKSRTFREVKDMERGFAGDIVPVVRCCYHGKSTLIGKELILQYSGKVLISGSDWSKSPEFIDAIYSFFNGVMKKYPNDWEKKYSLKVIYDTFRDRCRLPELIKLLENQPDLSPDALKVLADVYQSENENDKAIKTYLRLLNKTPDDGESRVKLAKVYAIKGDYQLARLQGQQAIRINPKDEKAQALIAELDAVSDSQKLKKRFADKPENTDLHYLVTLGANTKPFNESIKSRVEETSDILERSFGKTSQIGKLSQMYSIVNNNLKSKQWKTYNTIDGLPSAWAWDLVQDSKGIIWIVTGSSICQFDGKNFTDMNVKSNSTIQWGLKDKQGNLWFGTLGSGLIKYDGKAFTTYTTRDGLAGDSFYRHAVFEDKKGMLWFACYGGGISKYDGKTFTNITAKDGLCSNNVNSVIIDSQGKLWAGTDHGLTIYDGKTYKTFTKENGLSNNDINAMIEDNKGNIWLATGYGATCYDGSKFIIYTKKEGFTDFPLIRNIVKDRDGNLWFIGWGATEGAYCYDGQKFTKYTTVDGLAGGYIMGSFADREGNIWFAHNTGNGVSRYNPYGINLIRDLPVLHVNCITNDKSGNMWLSTDRGIFKYDGKDFTEPIPESRRVIGYTAKILADSKNNLWFATSYVDYLKDVRESVFITERGLLKFDGKKLTRFTTLDGMLSNSITDIIEDKKGHIWIAYGSGAWGREGGVSKYDGKEFNNFTTAEGLPSNDVMCLKEDHKGNIWIGTWGSGLCKYDGRKFTTFTKDDGLVNDSITRILEDSKGQIWVGTGEGLSKYDGKSFTNINELSGKTVAYIIEDHKGYLWLTVSNEGIVKTDGKTFAWITEDDGVPNPQFMNMLYEDKQGSIWIGSLGLSKYIPNPVPPIALIKSITADQVYNETKEISLPSGTKSFRVDFHGLSYRTRPEAIQYLYCLKGYDKDWQGPTKKASVDYLSITPGKYEFLVKAIDMDLNYSEPASMEVKIEHPPVYTRAGFIGGSIFLAFLIPSIIYSYLLTRQRRKQPFEPITSPYMVGGPIRNKDMFFGREEDFLFVNNRLKAEKEGITIVFFGQRRSGKTSLLHQILNGRLGENFMPVLIDMQEMPVNNDKEFFQKIADEISFGLSGTLEIDSYKYDFNSENPALVFEKFIDDVMAKSSGKTLLLMFDEYEILEEKMNEGIIKGTVPTFMAGILERHAKISLIFTGSRHLERRNPIYWRGLFAKSVPRRISLLSEEDTLRLIQEPVAGAVKYQRGVPHRIYRLTGGQPFYTQHVCQLLVERLNDIKRNRAYADDIEKTALVLADNPPPQMLYFWSEEIDTKERLVLVLLSRTLKNADDYASPEALAEYALSKNNVKLEITDVTKTLDGLWEYELLERERISQEEYEYRFRIDLFRYWVDRHQSIAQVIQEMNGEGGRQ